MERASGHRASAAALCEGTGGATPAEIEDELKMAQPKAPAVKLPTQFPDMPWKKKS